MVLASIDCEKLNEEVKRLGREEYNFRFYNKNN
jgi:hypothetical protein